MDEIRVGESSLRQPEREHGSRQDQAGSRPSSQASARFPSGRVKSATAPSTTPTAPSASATIVSVEVLPPRELFASMVGAGLSDDSEPFQSTTVPSE